MPKSSMQKLKLMYLTKIFREETDETHGLTLSRLISRLSDYGISAERKSLYDDIELLNSFGYNIEKTKGKQTDYRLMSCDFEMPELMLLSDAVACSKFISESKSRRLIEKIGGLTSHYNARSLTRQVAVANRVKTRNEKTYYAVYTIQQAINEKKQIQFYYFDYDVNKKKIYRRNKELYFCSPYSLAWQDENYYCVGYNERHSSISSFRIDKMESVDITDKPAVSPDKSFDIATYTNRVFGMFSGKEERVRMQFDNSLVNVVLDRFGKDILIEKIDDSHFEISAKVILSPPLYGWIFQFGGKARIMSPQPAIDGMRAMLDEVMGKY